LFISYSLLHLLKIPRVFDCVRISEKFISPPFSD
jgi:hypothetical protein